MKPLIVAAGGLWTRSSGETIEIESMVSQHIERARLKVERRLAKVRATLLYARNTVAKNETPATLAALKEIEDLASALEAKRDELTTVLQSRTGL